MLARILAAIRPFNVPRPAPTPAVDPIPDAVWIARRDRFRRDLAAHRNSQRSWAALRDRTSDLLRGAGQ